MAGARVRRSPEFRKNPMAGVGKCKGKKFRKKNTDKCRVAKSQ